MDELEDTVGKLSMDAKEWRPGQGSRAPPLTASSDFSSGSSSNGFFARRSSSEGSPGNSAVSCGGSVKDFVPSISSWGGGGESGELVQADQGVVPAPAVDVNGTHYFGGSSAPLLTHPNAPSHYHQHHISQPLHGAGDETMGTNGAHRNLISSTTLPLGPIPPPPHNHARATHRTLSLHEETWRKHRDMALESMREMDPDDPRHKAVPSSFHRSYCLEGGDDNHAEGYGAVRSSFGYPSSIFKACNRSDGRLYALRRFDGAHRCVSHRIAQTVSAAWTNARNERTGRITLDHPGLVRWYKCFLSQRAVFFVHRYHPGAATMRERFFDRVESRGGGAGGGGGVPLPEPFVWSCLTQLVSAISAVHGSGLAVRTLQLNHVLCTHEGTSPSGAGGGQKVRLRINCVGVLDVLDFEARKSMEELRDEDMRALGCLLLSLTTGTEIAVDDITAAGGGGADELLRCIAFVRQNYSRELHDVALSLLRPDVPSPSIRDVASIMALRSLEELDAAHAGIDGAASALAASFESGRALRLLLKLAFVNERPEFGIDRRWSESGDCYVLKLFRDYVFHQADGTGQPVMDLGHVVAALNKLDAVDDERIVLCSRDGRNVMVVSYADVAWCLEKTYQELCSRRVTPHSLP